MFAGVSPETKAHAVCRCRLCTALDEGDAWLAGHGGDPAQIARHLARQQPGLLHPARFAAALRERVMSE